jgi:hypothetical protein
LRQPTPFDASYKVVADSKLLLQVIRPEVTHYMGIDIAQMEAGGVSSNPAGTLKVMREFLRLESDLGYRIPKAQRLWYVTRSHAKSILYRVAGDRVVNLLARIKHSLVCIRP